MSRGLYGHYRRWDERHGVKTFRGEHAEEYAHAEYRQLQALDRDFPGLFPRPVRVCVCEDDGADRPAIVMEHVDGALLSSSETWPESVGRAVRDAVRALWARGYRWTDCHDANIFVTEGGVRFVDADPAYFAGRASPGASCYTDADTAVTLQLLGIEFTKPKTRQEATK